MLGHQDVGHRMVVRRIVGIRDNRPLFSDALGELTELTETHLTIITAKGPLRIPLVEVHRAKRVPPARRPIAADIAALELAANDAWPAPVQERLGDWLLRHADGWTGRANSALPVGDPGRPLDEAIDAVQRWYVAHDQPAMINVPLPLAAPVGRALDVRGWGSARPPVLVQTTRLTALLDAIPARAGLPAVELAAAPSPAWLDVAAGRKGELPGAARHVLTAVDQVRFAHLYAHSGSPGLPADAAKRSPRSSGPNHDMHRRAGGGLVAVARGTVTGHGRWLGLSLIEVRPEARRQGLAQHLIRALAGWANELGAADAFLQVEETNTAARPLYERLGFTTHHTYLTRVAPEITGAPPTGC